MEVCYIMMGPRSDGDCNAQWSPMGAAMLCDLWWGLEPRLLTVLFFGDRGEGCSLGASGGLFLPPGNRGEVLACVHACVCVCVYGEGKVSLCNEIFKSSFLGFLTDLRRGSQSPGHSPLLYLHTENVWPAWFLFSSPKGGTLVSTSCACGCLLTENTFQKFWRPPQRNSLERILKFQILGHWSWRELRYHLTRSPSDCPEE